MSDDAAPLVSFSLTHVYYDPSDPVSHACAWLALLPQCLCVVYATLVIATREAEVGLMFAGQLACEAVNFALKRLIKEQRPATRFHGRGYGMPSSHAQFVVFWAIAVSLFLLVRHQPHDAACAASSPTATGGVTTKGVDGSGGIGGGAVLRRLGPHPHPRPAHQHAPHSLLARLLASAGALALAGAVAWSRVYLGYHTGRQVIVGAIAGAVCAVVWFVAVSALRGAGVVDVALQFPLARWLRVRDLLVREDLCQAGWEKWEAERVLAETAKAR